MKKKDTLSQKDKEDWKNFLEDTSRVPDKDQTLQIKSSTKKFRFDLHGLTLDEANKKVKDIIKSCSETISFKTLIINIIGCCNMVETIVKLQTNIVIY